MKIVMLLVKQLYPDPTTDSNRVDQEPVARDFPSRWYMRVDTGK